MGIPRWQLPPGAGKFGQEACKPSSPSLPSLASSTPSWGLVFQSSLAPTLTPKISLLSFRGLFISVPNTEKVYVCTGIFEVRVFPPMLMISFGLAATLGP